MRIEIKFFAMQAQHAGKSQVMLEVAEDATVSVAVDILRKTVADLPWPAGMLVAVNQEYAGMDTPLHGGDEVALIPPVSGG